MHGDCSERVWGCLLLQASVCDKKANTKQLCLFLKRKPTGFLDSKKTVVGLWWELTIYSFPQVLQRVNERLLEKNPAEHQLFDVILITTESLQQQQNSSIINSTRHHGLEVSRFCFSTEEDYIESLMQNNVQLFLTTDGNEALQATQQGVPSALLDTNSVSCPSEQLRVLFCEKAIIQLNMGSTEASKKSAQNFLAHLGQMRQKFGVFDSPLCFTLVTSHGGKDSCCCALKSLRSLGVSVDEAYCLGGAPRGPIMSLLRPHFLLGDGFNLLEG